MTAFQPFVEKSIAACGNCPPALLMRLSTRPCAVQTVSNRTPDCLGFPDVGNVGGGLQVPAGQIGDECVEFGLVAPDNNDMRAPPREQPGERGPDAAVSSRTP